jgi:hypothetical protein
MKTNLKHFNFLILVILFWLTANKLFGQNGVNITSPEIPSGNVLNVSNSQVELKGNISDAGISKVTINNRSAMLKKDGSFFYDCFLKKGENQINIEAHDNSGNIVASRKITIIFGTATPPKEAAVQTSLPDKKPLPDKTISLDKKPLSDNTTSPDKKSLTENTIITDKKQSGPSKIIKPVIQWLSPTEQIVTTSNFEMNFNGLLEKGNRGIISIYNNNTLIRQKKLESADLTQVIIDEDVSLNAGINNIKIVVFNDAGENTYNYKIERSEKQKVLANTISPEIKNSYAKEDEQKKIQIKWINPDKPIVESSLSSYNIKGIVTTSSPLKEYDIYLNNTLQKQNVNEQPQFRGMTTDAIIDETLTLRDGANEIKVVVKNSEGSEVSNFTINYNMFTLNNCALIIAVQDYTDKNINTLAEPINDANKLINILTTSYTFDKKNIIFLKNPVKSEIVKTLYDLRKKLTTNDNLLIFYAGHGLWDESMQTGYWMPSDANKDNPVNWLPNSELKGYLKAIPTRHTLLITDACFSGGLFATRKAFADESSSAVAELIQTPSRKAISSGSMNVVPDKSVFMKYLLKYLKENNKKYMSTSQLFYGFRDAVINNSPIKQVPRFEVISEAGDEGGEFIFVHK